MSPATQEEREAPLDPDRPIVDPHHHLWDPAAVFGPLVPPAFLLPDMARMVNGCGHNIVQTVFVECWAMYRADGPEAMKRVGEVEFANGAAAMSASGQYGPCRIAAGIVGSADLTLGEAAAPVLEATVAAGNGRLRGIRMYTAFAECGLHGQPPDLALKGLMTEPRFHAGARALAAHGLVLDIYCMHPQLPDVATLADACPDVLMVLDHFGTPMNFGPYAGREAEAFSEWRGHIGELALRPNLVVKLGGLGQDPNAALSAGGTATSEELAKRWTPYVETCLEAFGVERCMFESNFPPDAQTCSYGTLWNTFKRIAAGLSEDEKTLLFSGVAKRVYRLG
jgi:predicted TIM-barrel fold metal-dependent hydrolase